MRKLTKTLVVVSLLAPVESYPVGIGDIKLKSALNQNLNAEIILYLEDDESIEDFRVGMAPSEKFAEAGVPWTASLAKIKFAPIVKANGKAVIKLSSDETIQEPFLSFLVRVAWPQGTQYKEFTVLVDPPATYLQPVIPASTIAQVPVRRSNSGFNRSSSPARSTNNRGFGASRDRVRVNDTLWKIAERVNRGRNSTIEQMMIALYEANPKAFYQKNVNTLSAGAVLNIPNNNAVLRLSARQARAEFSRQNQAWRNRSTTPSTSSVASTDSGSQLKLIAPDETGVNQQATVATKNVETSPNIKETAQGVSGNAELIARLEELERKLAAMQVALAIKNEKLAALQAREMLPEAGETTTPAIPENIPVQEQQQPELKPEVVQPEVTPVIVKPELVKPAIKPAPKKIVESEDSDDNSYFAWLAGIIALIGLLVGWVWRRKKIMEETISDESMFSSAFASSTHQGAEVSEISQMGSLPVSEDFSFQTGMVGENSILSEFTPSDFDAFETDQSEVDPISEADVYLAYGRYQQAEELMRKAIKDQPDRDECKLKLLEIFYANENTQEFENYANELTQSGKNEDTDFWGRVVEMGSEICPDLAIFKGSGSTGQTSASVFETIEKADSPSSVTEKEAVVVEATESLSFNTDSTDTAESNTVDFETVTDDSQAKDDVLESFDFDTEKTTDSAVTEDDVEFDFDMSFDSDEESVAQNGDSQGDELIEMDELETKIDLARAYIDMGDEDAARTIAEEVLSKGNDSQKQEAQKILDSL